MKRLARFLAGPGRLARQQEEADCVRVAQMDTLAQISPGSAIVGTIAAALVCATCWPRGSHLYIVAFLTALITSYVISVVMTHDWKRRRRLSSMPASVIWPRITLSALIGILWGSLPVALMQTIDDDQRLMVGLVCSGLVAAGLMLAPVLPAALLFTNTVVVGTAVSMFLQHGHGQLMGALILIYGGLISCSILDLNRRFTERVVATMQLQERGETIGLLLRDFEERSSDWLWQTDANGCLTKTSDRLLEVLRQPRVAVEGFPLRLHLSKCARQSLPGQQEYRHILQSFSQPAAFRDVIIPVRSDDEERWFSITGKPVYGHDGCFQGFRGVGADVTTARLSAARVSYLASTDGLTDLPNRSTLAEVLANTCATGEPFALFCLDLDEFKTVNDTFGHPAGDALLVAAARRMRSCLRAGDVLARLGGDEFAVVQAQGDIDTASVLARRLIETLSTPFSINDVAVSVGASVGIALAPTDGTAPDNLLKSADLALYGAKRDGRGTWRFFDFEMSQNAQKRSALQADLRQALLRNELELHFQPISDIASGDVVAMEALLRWNHPVRGNVSPVEFIPLAEEAGLIVMIGAWVLHEACAAATQWVKPVRVAVNLSPMQVRDSGLLETVDAALAASTLPADRLELEITESVFLEATEETRGCLHALRSRGIRIALDDFGTGYSSLSYLRSFPFDKVKIDRSFVSDVATDPSAAAIVQAIIGMANSLGMSTIGEGVEDAEQADALRTRGCTHIQGFLMSRPLPRDAAARLLSESGQKSSGTAGVRKIGTGRAACQTAGGTAG